MVKRFARSELGATMVETTLVIVTLLILLLGFVDFGLAFYQWNAAGQAVQVGARLAAVSTPVANGLLTAADTADTTLVGEPIPAGQYSFVCTGAGTCNSGSFNQAAFDLIFEGDATRPGMVDFYPGLANFEANVRIEYVATGLGYYTRPGGPVPTIRVSLEGIPFNFFFLDGLIAAVGGTITMPNMASTVTGEDLSTTFTN